MLSLNLRLYFSTVFKTHCFDENSNSNDIRRLKNMGEAGHLRQLIRDLQEDLKPNNYLEQMVLVGLMHSKEKTSLKRSHSVANLDISKYKISAQYSLI